MPTTRPSEQKKVPPYLPYKTFTTYLASLKAAGNPPGRIDRYGLPNYSGGVQTWILSALRFFGLIDAKGIPTEALTQLLHSEGNAHKTQLREMLRSAYPNFFKEEQDIKRITHRQACEQFKEYNLGQSTVERCVSFLTGMLKDADIELSPYLKKPKKSRQPNGASKADKRRDRQTPRGATPTSNSENDPSPVVPSEVTPGMKSIPIPLSAEKTWSIQIDANHDQKDIEKFLKVVALVLGAESV